jgi:ATP-binding cassette subfamily F protein 3
MNPVQFLASKFPGKTEQEYRQHLGNFQITGMTGLQPIGTLSGGQKSRVAFSLLSLQRPHILLLDEVRSSFLLFFFFFGVRLTFLRKPTNHLDLEGLDALMLALGKWNGGVIVISHDERFITSVAKEVRACCCLSCSTLTRSMSALGVWRWYGHKVQRRCGSL